ncbi:hypothetical protein HDU67_002284, partial [Dinochytrium kinnereticum]
GALLLCLRRLAIFALGGVSGLLLALLILNLKSGLLIDPSWARLVFIIVFVILGALVALKLEKPLIVTATSFVGAVNSRLIGMAVGVLVLAVIGVVVQFRINRGRNSWSDGKN